ncbi:hypothetical protein DMS24_28280 [Klebsiella variicola]|nr:hypothetical protein DMS24_28280 [Klebsiella variicola]
MVCVVGRMRDLILQLSKSSIYSTKPLFARYNFGNELKGLSISDYFGIQTSPLYEREFIQNRVQLAYDF